jgi:hypothetical protein
MALGEIGVRVGQLFAPVVLVALVVSTSLLLVSRPASAADVGALMKQLDLNSLD